MTDITELLRQAEMQQVNLQTEVQFQQNMAFFKQAQPDLHNQFREYIPEKLRLLYTDEGYLNLVNYNHNNLPVYPENPVDDARKFLQHYLDQPTEKKFYPGRTPCIDEETNAHMFNANKIADILNSQTQEKTNKLPASVNLMVMLGVGLGYHLEGLLKATELRNLCIIEPQADIFYASLHTIDWQPIFQHFSQPGHSLELIIGKDQETYIKQFNEYFDRIGGFNIVNAFIFRHLTNKALEESIDNFLSRIIQKQIFGLGFFDDEQVGLAHTIKNIFSNTPILHDHVLLNKSYLNKPAFIVANGPSLDQAVEFLQAHQDRAIIFSCGTALGSLTKMGIKPDFHIEQERPKFMLEWVKNAATAEERKGITLLALNTVHPEVFELFDRKAMAMKANDLGTQYITQYVKQNKQLINFGHCNPTVSNCGLAYASALGFQQVYLFGLDLGFPAGELHHSTFSKHYDIKESEENTLSIAKPDSETADTAPGNFGGKIITNAIFINSRVAIEAAIRANKGIHCFNTSKGVLIEGAQPLQLKDLKISSKPFNKKSYTDKILKKYFSTHVLREFSHDEVEKDFKDMSKALSALRTLAQSPVNSRQQGIDMLASLHAYITALAADKNTQYTANLLKGSIATFSALIAQALYRTNDEATNISLYKQCLQQFFDFLEQAKTKAESDLLSEDVTTHNLEKILEKSA